VGNVCHRRVRPGEALGAFAHIYPLPLPATPYPCSVLCIVDHSKPTTTRVFGSEGGGRRRGDEERASVVGYGARKSAVLRQGGAEQGLVDAAGGHAPHRLHPEARPRQLARTAQASR
jgi:hypothetical protein